jgi:hypothetical protein
VIEFHFNGLIFSHFNSREIVGFVFGNFHKIIKVAEDMVTAVIGRL